NLPLESFSWCVAPRLQTPPGRAATLTTRTYLCHSDVLKLDGNSADCKKWPFAEVCRSCDPKNASTSDLLTKSSSRRPPPFPGFVYAEEGFTSSHYSAQPFMISPTLLPGCSYRRTVPQLLTTRHSEKGLGQ